jgi:UDP-N-acetylglucosamine diphosphorylase / glucose-1-phosphate thymidylyltransferase / UDP-N-acetylgalactosamine diphosphorylase / glucosamine-1-phosphate N-acetyltransferase / galactosamine-1-phosphate N-acetyltransferase
MKNPKSEIRNPKQTQNSPPKADAPPAQKLKAQNFYPLTLTRPVEELHCGARTLADHPQRKINHLWDLIVNLKEDLERDIGAKYQGARVRGKIHPSAVIYNTKNVLIEEGAEVEACAVLDARSGPIYIGRNTIIRPQSYLRGPLSIGPECRIGGEVTHSIFHGYVNKAHYGFIGHAYIGEWVNLGAGTTNSNLKNNYGTVKVAVNGKEVDTGEQFLGCFIGDHAKTGIGTLITTGAVIGVAANIFGGGVTPKFVPSFSWGKETYDLQKMIAAAKIAMGRRGREMSAAEAALLKKIFEITADERQSVGL